MKSTKWKKLFTDIKRDRQYYLLILPAVVYLIIFNYLPMYGVQIAFKDYKMSLGIMNSKWVGLRHFKDFFSSYYLWPLIRNTLALSLYTIIAGFPVPIIIALIINELKGGFKKFTQTVLYAPHFISTVVLVGMMNAMLSPSMGVVNTILNKMGIESIYFLGEAKYFRHLHVWSGVWQSMGWSAIVYIAALSGVDPALHEAASIDGANRMQRILKINIPTIMPTIIIMLILKMGHVASVSHEKVYLLMNEMNVDVSEVISTYVYKRGLIDSNFSFGAAVGLFTNIVNISMVLITNAISRKVSETSLF